MWSFQGKILKRVALDKFCQLQWRPRPPTLMSSQQLKDIKKSLKKYSAQFDVKDRLKMSKASKELVEKRRKLMTEYEDLRRRKTEEYAANRRRRIELRNSKSSIFFSQSTFSSLKMVFYHFRCGHGRD